MAKTFVAINDPVHSLIRSVTRQIPLGFCLGASEPQYQIRELAVPDAFYTLAVFHSLGGLTLATLRGRPWRANLADRLSILRRVNYFDAVKLDRRCARDLRLKLRKEGPGLASAELLTFGTGTLRARNDDSAEQLHQYLWSQHGRIHSRHETVYARIGALHRNSLPLLYQARKETFDSTNIIYGDAVGELEQLWNRRAETGLLEVVARSLQRMRGRAEIAAYLHPPLRVETVMQFHLRAQALWKSPPASARALLRRLEFLLDHIVVDNCPCTFYRRHLPEPHAHEAPADGDWTADRSGYDGWLSSGNS